MEEKYSDLQTSRILTANQVKEQTRSVNMKKPVNLLAPERPWLSDIVEESKFLFFQSRFTVTWRHRDCVLFYIWFTPTKRIWIILNPGVRKRPRNSPRGPCVVRRATNFLCARCRYRESQCQRCETRGTPLYRDKICF